MSTLKVFQYIDELDCFRITDKYQQISDSLGLSEWHPAVWIGRLITLDNDYGEHWFDNWELREELKERAAELGYDDEHLLIIDPRRLQNGKDGPCHSDSVRKQFWTDVLRSMELSYELLFEKARQLNQEAEKSDRSDFINDLETRIAAIKESADAD